MKRALTSSFLAATFAFTTLGVASEASAQDQPWLADRAKTEGPGILVGDFELHPGIAAEFGYDHNFFRRADNEDPIGALRLRLTPSFSVSSLGGQRRPGAQQPDVVFRAGVNATYNEFIPVSGSASGQQLLQDSRNASGSADLSLKFFPGRTFFGELQLGASRLFQPSQQGIDVGFNRWTMLGSAEVGWAPRGGVFEARLGYRFDGTVFEAQAANGLSNMNNTITARGRWRFLPRTSLMFDGSVGFIDYFSPNQGGNTVQKTSSVPVRARVGFNGLVTDWLSILAVGGWGASFYRLPAVGGAPATSQDFDSFIGQVEAKFFLTPNPKNDPSKATLSVSSLSLGFARDFYDSYISTYFERNRGYLNLSYFFGGRVLLSLDGGVAGLSYPGTSTLNGIATPWTDIQVDATAFAEYRFKDWLGANVTGRYTTNISDRVITDGLGKTDSLQWQTIEAYLGLRLMF